MKFIDIYYVAYIDELPTYIESNHSLSHELTQWSFGSNAAMLPKHSLKKILIWERCGMMEWWYKQKFGTHNCSSLPLSKGSSVRIRSHVSALSSTAWCRCALGAHTSLHLQRVCGSIPGYSVVHQQYYGKVLHGGLWTPYERQNCMKLYLQSLTSG